VESAGFELMVAGNFLSNPADPRDRNIPEPARPKDQLILEFSRFREMLGDFFVLASLCSLPGKHRHQK